MNFLHEMIYSSPGAMAHIQNTTCKGLTSTSLNSFLRERLFCVITGLSGDQSGHITTPDTQHIDDVVHPDWPLDGIR
ncbi:hypothetical protein KFK09_019889 [Dendrobium nobile]|uniref:Uncharacterized protein n=1 Tax=Dendrobium nobile TaxID=94219 RepID=A0A8T3ARR6_DENNO|nr:hypothetical protein KFK09_019889 [Dendrobium nobile]